MHMVIPTIFFYILLGIFAFSLMHSLFFVDVSKEETGFSNKLNLVMRTVGYLFFGGLAWNLLVALMN